MAFCKKCNKWVAQSEGKKPKEFCNSTCRSNYWYARNKKVKTESKGVDFPKDYVQVKEVAILKPSGEIEPLSFEKMKAEITQQKLSEIEINNLIYKYMEERRDCQGREEFMDWENRLKSDSRLTDKQKQTVKDSRL